MAIGVLLLTLLSLKALLIRRININWDEFNFLSHVHEQARGELTLLIQGSYTHLFTWLTQIAGHEIEQVIAGRSVMLGLLTVTVLLVWKLASRWLSPGAAATACVCYLAMLPVMKHGGSFRYDSLLAPLLLFTLVALTSKSTSTARSVVAGISLGASAAISVKAALMIPLVLALMTAVEMQRGSLDWLRNVARTGATTGAAAIVSAVLLLAIHGMSLTEEPQHAGQYIAASAQKTLVETPLFPRSKSYSETRREDSLAWLLIYAGTLGALLQARYRSASVLSLSLIPILFYRNAFSYYYVIMLAPACVLAGVAVETIHRALIDHARHVFATLMLCTLAVALFSNGLLHAYRLRHDDILRQRVVVDAVHTIFPTPVEYVDHSGMIGSFRKVNFFMSGWGLENYRLSGKSFMEAALERCVPLVLANRPVLDPSRVSFKQQLLPIDQQLLLDAYIPYWGPIKVAGTRFAIAESETVVASVPCPGRYRLEASAPVEIEGVVLETGTVIDVTRLTLQISAPGAVREVLGRLVPAITQAAPRTDPPHVDLYTPL